MADLILERRKGKTLVELLDDNEIGCCHQCLCSAAADRIEQLEAALKEILSSNGLDAVAIIALKALNQ